MNKKSGITMIVLVITIIIALIILSVSMVSINNTTKNATVVSFQEELTNIENEISKYFLLTGELPSEDGNKYTKEEISNLSSNSDEFLEEISINNENEEAYFFKVDLTKLNFEDSTRGIKINGENDLYVASYPDLNLYYLKGINVDGIDYFSLAKLNKNNNIDIIDSKNEVSLYSGDLYVKKTNNNWSNKLNLEVSSFIEEGQSIKVIIPQENGETISNNLTVENNKTNTLSINSLSEIGFSDSQIIAFNEINQENKKITIQKNDNNVIVGEVEVDLSNYDYTIPTYSTDITKESYSKYNKIMFKVSDSLSGINEVKYKYYKKIDEQLDTTFYEDLSLYEGNEILENGNTADIIDGVVTIKVPKNVTSIKCIITDKSGNKTGVFEIDTAYPIYIKYKTISGTLNSITFDASVESDETVTDFLTAVSIDGVSYTSDYSHGAITDLNSFTYTDIENIYDYIFIKISVKVGNITEIRIIQVDTSNFIKEGTTDKSKATWDNPYIPEGFIHTTGNVRNGFVIQDVSDTDNKYNEFVWVPVDYIYDNTTLSKSENESTTKLQNLRVGWEKSKNTSTTATLDSTYVEPYPSASQEEINEYNAMISSVEKYGGFYVARYEAGDSNATSVRDDQTIQGKISSRKGIYIYNYISFSNSNTDLTGGAVEISRKMYNNSSDIKSHLIYGAQWDSIMHWANMEGKNVSSSNAWGNYADSILNAAEGSGESNMTYITGKNNSWITNNIYDIAGSSWELTMECNDNVRVVRGGSYIENGETEGASYRNNINYADKEKNISFRPVLYITE